MKFLILVSFLIAPTLSSNPILLVKKCVMGDSNPACNLPDACNNPKTSNDCPQACNLCPYQRNYNKITFTKDECPKEKEWNGQKTVGCWEIDFKNQNGREIIYFYKTMGDFVYKGVIQSYPNTEIVAIGDVVNGKEEVTFAINSELTEDALGEANTDSKKVPIVPGLYEVREPGSAMFIREVMDIDSEAAKEIQKERSSINLKTRASLPKVGFKVNVLPVLDPKIRLVLGNKTNQTVAGLLNLARVAFEDSSLKIKFSLNFKEPVLYNKNLSASAEGYVSTLQNKNGPRFDYSAVGKDVNAILFFSHAFVEEIDAKFRVSYSILGGTCRSPTERVAIINFFASNLANAEAIRRAIATILGFKPDYIETPNAKDPVPRFGPNGENCTKVGGFMDIPVGAKIWTPCSNDDIQKVFQLGELSCLEEVVCDKKDLQNFCPILAKNVENACMTKFMKDSCPLSCDRPICSGPVLANATLPDSYICEGDCKDRLTSLCRKDRCEGNFLKLCKKTCNLC